MDPRADIFYRIAALQLDGQFRNAALIGHANGRTLDKTRVVGSGYPLGDVGTIQRQDASVPLDAVVFSAYALCYDLAAGVRRSVNCRAVCAGQRHVADIDGLVSIRRLRWLCTKGQEAGEEAQCEEGGEGFSFQDLHFIHFLSLVEEGRIVV